MKRMYGWLAAFGLALAGAGAGARAAQVEIPAAPAADGMLLDTDGDGVVDQALSVAEAPSRQALEVQTGKLWKANRKAVFEFQLPENVVAVSRATLRLAVNGKFGCYPEKEGASGPETLLFYYLAPEADGKIDLVDDDGEALGKALDAKPVDPGKPVAIDVTAAVKAALERKSPWVGLRLEAAPDAPENVAWRWRTSEFGALHGKRYTPTLVLATE